MGTDVSAEFCASVFREEEQAAQEKMCCREEAGTGTASELIACNDVEPVV
jgi:hypothetical protein